MKDLAADKDTLDRFLWATKRMRELKEVVDECRSQLLNALGENDIGGIDGVPIIQRTRSKRNTLDTKALRAEQPEIAAQYVRTSEVESLRIT